MRSIKSESDGTGWSWLSVLMGRAAIYMGRVKRGHIFPAAPPGSTRNPAQFLVSLSVDSSLSDRMGERRRRLRGLMRDLRDKSLIRTLCWLNQRRMSDPKEKG